MKNKFKVLLSGGGSGGPVTPLLAVVDTLVDDTSLVLDFLWLGTEAGPEKAMIEKAGLDFQVISSGKLRRYFSWKNFIDPFKIAKGYFDAVRIIRSWRPDLVMSAGAFVSVPVVWAAYFFRIPVIIHQQDARPGLANRLMAPFATIITVTFEKSMKDYGPKARWVGNPIRQDFTKMKLTKREATQKFGLRSVKPILVVMGGGTGALGINKLIEESINELTKFCQIIHITGQGKATKRNDEMMETIPEYKYFEFLDIFGVIKAFTVADVIVSRCGMGTLTELSQLGLCSVLIPMPDSHQEENAHIYKEAGAAVVLDQNKISKEEFVAEIKKLILDPALRQEYGAKIKTVMKADANKAMYDIVLEVVG